MIARSKTIGAQQFIPYTAKKEFIWTTVQKHTGFLDEIIDWLERKK